MLTVYRTHNDLEGFEKSFIGNTVRRNPKYAFLPHFEHFLKNKYRWCNTDQVLNRILAGVPEESEKAWETWRQYRSAQAEITAIFLIENYLYGKVQDLEVARPGFSKRCDIHARFNSGNEYYLEVKAQSGQQHGTKHPLADGIEEFSPQSEEDLLSWLFTEKSSSRTGMPMQPYCSQASEKGADVLIAMDDIFEEESESTRSLGKLLVPDHRKIENKDFRRNKSDCLSAVIMEAGKETTRKMQGLREVWVFDNSKLGEMLIIHAENSDIILTSSNT